MARIDQLPQFRARLPKNSHVLSHNFDFTATVAHLNPIFHTFMNPGEKIKLGFDFNLRTQPLVQAAFADLTVHTEYFFVPIQLLYQLFDNVVYNVDENFSSVFRSVSGSVGLPLLDLNEISESIQIHRNQVNLTRASFDGTDDADCLGVSALRLFDFLGLDARAITMIDGYHYQPNVFPYQLLAYNCIYQHYYRLDNREKFDHDSFNLDRFYTATEPLTSQDFDINYCRLHYRPFDNDYFTDVKTSPITDTLNMDSSTLQQAYDWLSGNTNISPEAGSSVEQYTTFAQNLGSGGAGVTGDADYGVNPTTVGDIGLKNVPSGSNLGFFGYHGGDILRATGPTPETGNLHIAQFRTPHTHSLSGIGGSALSTANIRALFATEKLWSITGRAKKNYDDQTLAHFGFKVPHDVKHQISCFGHDLTKIHIGEVISTASTEDAPLGEIAGKGYGAQSNQRHTFVAPCHGVVMAIFSVVPTRNYEVGFTKFNVLTDKNDLYQPEYDALGMQPMFLYEVNSLTTTTIHDYETASEIVGWQYRYEQWKRRFNRVSGAFCNNEGSLNAWDLSYQASTRQPYVGDNSFENFIYLPQDINQIMLAQYSGAWSNNYDVNWAAIYDNDPFVVNGRVDAVLLSTMSDYSLPRLDA